MIFSLQNSADDLASAGTSGLTPGLYLRPPAPETYAVTPTATGLTGFVGYARRRATPDAAPDLATLGGRAAPNAQAPIDTASPPLAPPWPVHITSLEQARLRLEVPSWGLLLPALSLFFANGGRECLVVGLSDDAPFSVASLLPSDPERAFGLPAFDRVGGLELILAPDLFVVPPNRVAPGLEQVLQVQRTLIDFAAGQLPSSELGGGLALLDVPPGLTPTQLLTYVELLRLHPLASHAALYGPWVQVPTHRNGLGPKAPWHETLPARPVLSLPPTAAIAGMMAALSSPPPESNLRAVSADFGPHQSPANHRLEGIFGLESPWNLQTREVLLQSHINCLIPRSGDGFRLWGDRTLSIEPLLRQITVRRILSFIHRSVYLSSRWAVFEPNTWTLWLQLTAQTEIFLESLYNAGVVVGTSPEDAFFVKCDSDTNPPEAVEEGRITLLMYVRPARATEVMVVEVAHRADDRAGEQAAPSAGPSTRRAQAGTSATSSTATPGTGG